MRRRNPRLHAAVLLLLLPSAALAADALRRLKSAVNTEVSAARKAAPALGVSIVELGSGDEVYSYNAGTLRILASNTKLLTSAAALDRLGPGFFFETELLIRGDVEKNGGGTLVGDLAVVGGGDPTLSGRDHDGDSFAPFRPWAQRLRELGIGRVNGRLLLHHGLFDDERVHPDWPKDQLKRWYEAPVDALSFNDNCVLLKVKPDGKPGTPARVEVVPPVPIFRVVSTAVTSSWRQKQWISIDRRDGEQSHVLTASGKISVREEQIDKWLTVTDPPLYFGAGLRAAFAEEGIVIDGPAVPVTVLPAEVLPAEVLPAEVLPAEVLPAEVLSGDGWRVVYTHRTGLLPVLDVLNKRSQNFYAESVAKLLGARLCGDGSWAGGRRAMAEFLADVGIEPGTYSLADGSGMSRGNRLTPRQMTTLLAHMFDHPWGRQYLRTLPFSGEEDLKWVKRLVDEPYLGNVMAKTGYLNGVSALSGYAKARSGKVYAFSILCNGIRSKSAAEKAQDKIVRALIDNG